MPYKKGSLKGQLTTAEIRKLISAHNKLSKITIPPRSTRDAIMSIISKAGFRVNHEQQKLEQTTATKKDISLEKAKDVTKRVPKTEQQKKQSTERMEKKKVEKEKELKLAKKEGVKEFKAKKKDAEKKKPVEKPVEKPKKKTSTIGTQTEKPKSTEKKKVLQLEDKKKSDKTFKIERTERSKMISQLKQEYGNTFNPFKILGITASQETPELVKQRCRELRLKEHPDKGGDKKKFEMIQKACDVLMRTQTPLKKTEKKEEKKEVKKEEVKKPVRKKQVIIKFRNRDENELVDPTNMAVRSKIEKEYPGYKGYERINLIKLQADALNETPFKNRPMVEVLVKNNEGRDLQLQFGVEESSTYGKRIILKKSSTDKKRPVKIFLTGGDGFYEKPDGKRTKSRPALEKAWDKIGVDIKFATDTQNLEAMEKRLKEQGIELYKSGNDKDVGDAVKKPVSVKDIFDELVANSDEKILPFNSYPSSSMLMYAEILDRNKNDCSLPLPLLLETITKLGMLKFLKDYSEEIAKEILRCHKHSKGKKAVVLPLTFINKKTAGSTHANALVFNTIQMTAEHFEPHGLVDYVPARKGWLELEGVNLAGGINAINKDLKRLAKQEGLKEFSKGLKYVRPVDVCPSESMYKNFKGVYSGSWPKKEPVDFEGFTIKEKGGYCQLWTYFLLDLRLKTLDKPSQEVLKEYATYRDVYKNSIGENPNKTMNGLERGYSNMYFNIIRKLINEGKFSMEEFLKHRDYNSELKKWKDMSEEERKFLRDTNRNVADLIFQEASEKMKSVMKDAQK